MFDTRRLPTFCEVARRGSFAAFHGTHYAKAQNLALELRSAYDRALDDVDLLCLPTSPLRATRLPRPDGSIADYVRRTFDMMENTSPFDTSGHPAISVPAGVVGGLPVGMMLLGRHFDEPSVLRAAHAFESRVGGASAAGAVTHRSVQGSADAGSGPAVTFATTEHFNLQTARALTVSEANGRASIYLATLSGNLIALAFVGQMSRLGAAFYAFALILLPVLAFVGLVTFLRLVQSSIEDLAYANRIALLRGFYLRVSPELAPYLVAAAETRPAAPSAWQLTLTAAGMVAVVNSVVVASCAGLMLNAAGVQSLAISVAVGAVLGAAAFTLHERHHRRAFAAYSPDAVDLAAIFVPPSQRADAG